MSELVQALQTIRAEYPPQRRMLAGHEWEFIVAGRGSRTVLVLPGGLAVAETGFRYIEAFAPIYRVVAPTYPPSARTIDDYTAGLAALVQAVGTTPASVIGGSYSGLVAQWFLRHSPELIDTLILSDTGVPWQWRRLAAWIVQPVMRWLPLGWLRGLLWRSTAQFLATMNTNQAFWMDYFRQRTAQISRAECLSHAAVWRAMEDQNRFQRLQNADWNGRMLLIDAEDDALFGPSEQRRLRRLYPRAATHTFATSPHCASLDLIDDYIAVIREFLCASSNV